MARTPAKNGKASKPMATTLMLPPTKKLLDLADTKRIQKKKSDSAIGVYRQKLGEMTEKDHLDKAAWGIAVGLHEIEDEETLHVRYFHLMHYLEELGVVKRATAQEEMFSAGEMNPKPNGNGADEEEEADDTSASKRVGAAAREVAEKAGARLHSDN